MRVDAKEEDTKLEGFAVPADVDYVALDPEEEMLAKVIAKECGRTRVLLKCADNSYVICEEHGGYFIDDIDGLYEFIEERRET